MPSSRKRAMIRCADAARFASRARLIGPSKQHRLPISCQFWCAGWVIQARMSAVGITEIQEGPVQHRVHAALDDHRVDAGQRQQVDLVLPAWPVPVRRGVAVGVLVQRIAVAVRRFPLDHMRGQRQRARRGRAGSPLVRYLFLRDVFQIPVDAEQQRAGTAALDPDVLARAGDAKAFVAIRRRQRAQLDLRGLIAEQSLQHTGGRGADRTLGRAGRRGDRKRQQAGRAGSLPSRRAWSERMPDG